MEQEKVQAGAAATPKGSLSVYGGGTCCARSGCRARERGRAKLAVRTPVRRPPAHARRRISRLACCCDGSWSREDYCEAAIYPSHRIPPTPHIAQDGRNLSSAFAQLPRRFPAYRPRIALPAAHHRLHRKPHPDLLTSTNRLGPSSLLAHSRYPRRTMGGNPQGRA